MYYDTANTTTCGGGVSSLLSCFHSAQSSVGADGERQLRRSSVTGKGVGDA